jgi:hypothetical protein
MAKLSHLLVSLGIWGAFLFGGWQAALINSSWNQKIKKNCKLLEYIFFYYFNIFN